MYTYLKNVTKIESDLMKEIIAWEGEDKEMANFVAQDRLDVQEAKDRYFKGHMGSLSSFIDRLDTCVRERLVVAFAEDLGSDWVETNLGYRVNV